MKNNRLSLSLLLVGLIGSAQPLLAQQAEQPKSRSFSVTLTAPDPAVQIRDTVRLLRANDVAGLLSALVPPNNLHRLRQAYEAHRVEPITDTERQEFNKGVAQLLAADGVAQMMAEIEPKLLEARPKASGAVMMGIGALQVALASQDNGLTDAQRASLQAALPGFQRWASSTDFLSALSMRQALTLLSDAARGTGVNSVEALRALNFEQILAKSGAIFAASKEALLIYGVDLDAIANSLQVQVLNIEGQTARVRTTVTVFDAPISSEQQLVLIEGRWYSENVATAWKFDKRRAPSQDAVSES
jgi:hypothetical protein